MPPQRSKLGIHNSQKAPLTVYVEPWGNDYTLMPEEELEVEVAGYDASPWFQLTEWCGSIQVWCNEADDFLVMQGDRELECGHQRPTDPLVP